MHFTTMSIGETNNTMAMTVKRIFRTTVRGRRTAGKKMPIATVSATLAMKMLTVTA